MNATAPAPSTARRMYNIALLVAIAIGGVALFATSGRAQDIAVGGVLALIGLDGALFPNPIVSAWAFRLASALIGLGGVALLVRAL